VAATRTGEIANVDNAEELRLLSRVADRDRDALTALYSVYHPRLFRFLYRLTNSYTAADELVNDIMLAVWKSASSFRGESRVSTWVFGIAYRQAMRRMRRRRLKIRRDKDPDEFGAQGNRDVEAEDLVRQGLESLPPAQQLAMLLVFYQGLSYAEVADVTGYPVNTVKTRMYHARRKLRDFLDAAGALPAASAGQDR